MKVVEWEIGRVRPYEKNPRIIPEEAVERVAASIREFGFQQPIVVDKDGVIIVGHTRLKAAEKLGLEKVPVVVADLSPEKARAYRLADNKTNEATSWDDDLLFSELTDIEADIADLDFSMLDFGFSALDLGSGEPEGGEPFEDDFDGEVPDETDIKKGDMYQLGEHVLMCGDSTSKDDVKKLMGGGTVKADMVFTDPPYGVNVKGGKKKSNIAGDLTQTAIPFSFELAVEEATKDKARFYFCGGEQNIGLYNKLFERYLAQIPKLLVWVKNGFVLKHAGYHNAYELIFYGFKAGGGGLEFWYSDRTERNASDVWQIARDPSNQYAHPTQKPVEIAAHAIRNSSTEGDVVLDLFGGSGTTLIACEQLGRKCCMMELDPHCCQVIIERWQALTGQMAVKIA